MGSADPPWLFSNDSIGNWTLFSLYPVKFLAEILGSKRQINKRKTNRSLLTCVPHVYMGHTQEK